MCILFKLYSPLQPLLINSHLAFYIINGFNIFSKVHETRLVLSVLKYWKVHLQIAACSLQSLHAKRIPKPRGVKDLCMLNFSFFKRRIASSKHPVKVHRCTNIGCGINLQIRDPLCANKKRHSRADVYSHC